MKTSPALTFLDGIRNTFVRGESAHNTRLMYVLRLRHAPTFTLPNQVPPGTPIDSDMHTCYIKV